LIKEGEMGLEGKVAIVTGASRKIGKKIAETFVNEKMKVAIVSAHDDTAKASQKELGGDTIAIACDVSNESAVEEMVNRTIEAFGEINVLVNNAAVTVRKPLLELSSREFSWVIDVNLKGTFLCTKYVVARMVEWGKGGKIVNIIASSVFRSRPNFVAYAASKAGIWNMTRQLALELAPHNINVNSVAPGRVGAPVGVVHEAKPRPTEGIPLRRLGTAEDIANAVLFLVSDRASYITGANLPVDGGVIL